MPAYSLSDASVLPFIVIPLVLVGLLAWGAAAAWRRDGASPTAARRVAIFTLAGAALWMTATWIASDTGALRRSDRVPPPFAVMAAGIFTVAAGLAFSPFGRRLAWRLPLWVLVAVQGFRLPLELAMHAMYERGIMPEQMSYSGRNFDIITGVTAVIVALLVRAGWAGTRLVSAWNLLGLALLANITIVSMLSTPTFQYFGPDRVNVWVFYPPFVWLPTVMVLLALAGHLVIFRAVNVRP